MWNNLSERKKDGQIGRDRGLLSTFSLARPVDTALKAEEQIVEQEGEFSCLLACLAGCRRKQPEPSHPTTRATHTPRSPSYPMHTPSLGVEKAPFKDHPLTI